VKSLRGQANHRRLGMPTSLLLGREPFCVFGRDHKPRQLWEDRQVLVHATHPQAIFPVSRRPCACICHRPGKDDGRRPGPFRDRTDKIGAESPEICKHFFYLQARPKQGAAAEPSSAPYVSVGVLLPLSFSPTRESAPPSASNHPGRFPFQDGAPRFRRIALNDLGQRAPPPSARLIHESRNHSAATSDGPRAAAPVRHHNSTLIDIDTEEADGRGS